LYPRPERTSSWNAKKRWREGATAKGERAQEREQETASGSTKASKGIQATGAGIDPGTLTLGHVIHDH